jgi:hypothetical protein
MTALIEKTATLINQVLFAREILTPKQGTQLSSFARNGDQPAKQYDFR